MSDNENNMPDIKSVDVSEASGTLKPTFQIATTGNYKKYVKGDNKEYVQGTKLTVAGGVLDVAVTGRLNYNSDVVTSYNAARKLEFNLSKQYKLSLGGSHSIEKQSTVQTKEFMLMTVGMSVAEQTRWKRHEAIINGVGKLLTAYKLPYLANTLFGQTTTGVYAKVAPWGNPKGYSDWWQSNVMDIVGKNARDFAGYVSYLNKIYTLTFKYESLFHATNIPRQVFQLSKEKGVFLTGGDANHVNNLDMTDSLHLSSLRQPRLDLLNGGYKNIFNERDVDADADESGLLNTPDRIQRAIGKKLTNSWAGNAKKLGEYNGLKEQYKLQSFVNISHSKVTTKTEHVITKADTVSFNADDRIDLAARNSFSVTVRNLNSDDPLSNSSMVLHNSSFHVNTGESTLNLNDKTASLYNLRSKGAIIIDQDSLILNKGDASRLTISNDKIELAAGGGAITIANNSVSIGSDLKVMGIGARSKFNDLGKMKKDIDKLKKDFESEVKKRDSELEKKEREISLLKKQTGIFKIK
jgi:hypothetical protein